MLSPTLLEIIQKKVFVENKIQAISLQSTDEKVSWIFDFKSVALSEEFLKEYARVFWETFKGYDSSEVQIGGMESGAIPLIVGTTLFSPQSAHVSSFYIRKSRKKSDLANMIEGQIAHDVPIILVDDILNTGTTLKKQIAILEGQGYKVKAIFTCIRFRDMSEYQDVTAKGIRIESIFELNDLSDVLPVKNIIPTSKKDIKKKYHIDYKVSLTKHPNLYAVVPKSGPVLSGEFIFMGSDDGTFYCLSKDTGDVVWTYKVPFGAGGKRIFSTCAVHNQFIMFGAYDGNFYCLHKETGKLAWVFMDADWIGSSPCVDVEHGIVFVGLEFGLFKKQGGLVAIDIKTGKALWKNYTMKGLTHASPAYSKKYKVVVCGNNDNTIYAFDATSGKVVWNFETKGEVKYGASFDDEKGLVFIGSMDGGLYALSTKEGKLYHRFEARAGFYSTPLVTEGFVYIGSLDKRLYCFDIKNKKTRWTFETRGRIFASPIDDGNSLFIGSNDGVVYEIDKVTGSLISSIQLTERIVNRIQIDHTKNGTKILYVGTHLCELYRITEQ